MASGGEELYTNHPLKMSDHQMIQLKNSFFLCEQENAADFQANNKKNSFEAPSKFRNHDLHIDLKQFCRLVSKIIDKDPDIIEQEILQLSTKKKISFEEFHAFQKEFIDILYANIVHPFDMSLLQLNEIRIEFEEAAKRQKDITSTSEGISVDALSQSLAKKLNVNPSKILKYLKNSSLFNTITWRQFQSMLEKESTTREELLDWFMNKGQPENPLESTLEEKIEYNLKPKDRSSQRIFLIEHFLQIKIAKKIYFLVVFDEQTIALYDAITFQSVLEFSIPQDFLSEPINEFSKKLKHGEETHHHQEEKAPATSAATRRRLKTNASRNLTCLGQEALRSPSRNQLEKPSLEMKNLDSIEGNQRYYNVSLEATPKNKRESLSSPLGWTPRKKNFSKDELLENKKESVNTLKSVNTLMNYQISPRETSEESKQSYDHAKFNNKKQSVYLGSTMFTSTFNKTNNSNINTLNSTETLNDSLSKMSSKNRQSHFQNQTQSTKNSRSNSLLETLPMYSLRQIHEQNQLYKTKNQIFKEAATSSARNYSYDKTQRNSITANFHNISSAVMKSMEEEEEQAQIKMEDDPNLHLVIKVFLTSDAKDQEAKRRLSFNSFYEVYTKDPKKYSQIIPSSSIQPKIQSKLKVEDQQMFINNQIEILKKDQENFMTEEGENKNILKKLWKTFGTLPPELTGAFSKAINEIIRENNLKQVNLESIKLFSNPALNLQHIHSSLGRAYKSANNQNKNVIIISNKQRLNKQWRSKTGKQYLQDAQDLDSHLNIDPWTSEMKERPQHKIPVFLKQIQDGVWMKIKERQLESTRNVGKQKIRDSIEVEEKDEMFEIFNENKKKEENYQRSKRMKSFSMEFSPELSLLGVGLINRQLQLFSSLEIKQKVEMTRVYWHQFNECVIRIQFKLNKVTKKWNIAMLFENDTLGIYEFVYKEEKISQFDLFFAYQFIIEVDKMISFKELGIVVTSYKGEFFLFQDHLASSNSYDQVKSMPKYYLDQQNKLEEKGISLSITSLTYSEAFRIIFFGTSKGKIAFYEVKIKEFSGIKDAGDGSIINLHVFEKQNQLISICNNSNVIVWDISRKTQMQSFKGSEERLNLGFGKISTSFFSQEFETLMITANSLKIWEMRVDKSLVFNERKMHMQLDWRNKNISKQQKYFTIEGDKSLQTMIHNQITYQTPSKQRKSLSNQYHVKGKGVLKVKPSMNISKMSAIDIEKRTASIIQVLSGGGLLIIYDSAGMVRVVQQSTFKTKYSFMLSVDENEKIEAIDIFDNKILAISTERGNIYLKSMYSQEVFQKISDYPGYPQKMSHLVFLPNECQMTLAAATQEGKVLFLNSCLKKKAVQKSFSLQVSEEDIIEQQSLNILKAHSKRVMCIVSNKLNTLASVSEDNDLVLYSLRACNIILKVDLAPYFSGYLINGLHFSSQEKQYIYLQLESGDLYQVKCSDGKIKQKLKCNVGKFASIQIVDLQKELLSVDESLTVQIFKKAITKFEQVYDLQIKKTNSQISNGNGNVNNIVNTFIEKLKSKSNVFDESVGQQQDKIRWQKDSTIKFSLNGFFQSDLPIYCISTLFDEISQVYYIFFNLKSAFIIDLKKNIIREFTYSDGFLSTEVPIQNLNEKEKLEEQKKELKSQFVI